MKPAVKVQIIAWYIAMYRYSRAPSWLLITQSNIIPTADKKIKNPVYINKNLDSLRVKFTVTLTERQRPNNIGMTHMNVQTAEGSIRIGELFYILFFPN
jgi:hypothetical protein